MAEQDSRLSNEELMHIALHANREGKNQETIEALRQILDRDEDDAKALYMLAAVHAEIGMNDQAVTEMARAVELDPSLTTAHFQLGLLHYMADRYDDAADAWQPLAEEGEFRCLFLFKSGLLAIADGDYSGGIDLVEQGIAENTFNAALNDDMRRIVDNVRSLMKDAKIAGAGDEQEAADVLARRALRKSDLSVYGDGEDESGS